MNHPKQPKIRLPFDVPRPSTSRAPAKLCGVCRVNEGKYTCPRCNLLYCSLPCFRDEAHTSCSEAFYRTTVMDQISSEPGVALEEKKAMVEMLRRFEEEAAEGADLQNNLGEEDEEEDEDELAEKLNGVDLDSIDTNQLFHLLPQAHRDKFLEAIRNPESDLTKELLEVATRDPEQNNSDAPGPSVLPWWEKDCVMDEIEIDPTGYADAPALLGAELEGVVVPPGIGLKLVYNATALSLAYTHLLLSFRLPSLEPTFTGSDTTELRAELQRLVPFLPDAKSTLRYTSVRDAYSAIWEKIGHGLDPTPSVDILIRLLTTLANLVHSPITLDPPKVLHVLADGHGLYAGIKGKEAVGVTRKLAFYAVAMKQLERADWRTIELEIRKEIGRLEDESRSDEGSQDDEEQHRQLRIIQ